MLEDKFYEKSIQVPGIEKDKIQLNATDDSIEISGEQSEEESTEDKENNYIYNERSSRIFLSQNPNSRRNTSFEGITARMNNGILQIDIPKKAPSPASWRKYENRNRIDEQALIIFFLFVERLKSLTLTEYRLIVRYPST